MVALSRQEKDRMHRLKEAFRHSIPRIRTTRDTTRTRLRDGSILQVVLYEPVGSGGAEPTELFRNLAITELNKLGGGSGINVTSVHGFAGKKFDPKHPMSPRLALYVDFHGRL